VILRTSGSLPAFSIARYAPSFISMVIVTGPVVLMPVETVIPARGWSPARRVKPARLLRAEGSDTTSAAKPTPS
jgi:hypothetical protein